MTGSNPANLNNLIAIATWSSLTTDMLGARGWTPTQLDAVTARWKEVQEDEDNFYNADNLRVARLGDNEELEEYDRLKNEGCCGCHDLVLEITETDGSVSLVKFGFNFGH